jgi:hypothetical protein
VCFNLYKKNKNKNNLYIKKNKNKNKSLISFFSRKIEKKMLRKNRKKKIK